MSSAHPAVVRKAPVKYRRDTTGISMYLRLHPREMMVLFVRNSYHVRKGTCNGCVVLLHRHASGDATLAIGKPNSPDKPRYNTNENPLHLTYHDIKSKPPPAAGISMFVSSLCGVCPKEIETCTG